MRNQGFILVGVLLITAGLMFLFGNLFDINIAAFCLPVGLILIGALLIVRPRMIGPGVKSDVLFIGDIERTGQWSVSDEELWSFIGDVSYDLTRATVDIGETSIRLYGFINDVEIIVPSDIGVSVTATGFITSFKLAGHEEEEAFLAPIEWQSEGYKMAERRVRFDLTQFIGEIKVRPI